MRSLPLKGTRVQHMSTQFSHIHYHLLSFYFLSDCLLKNFIIIFRIQIIYFSHLFTLPEISFFLSIFIPIPRISLPSSLILVSNLWLSILSFHLQSFISSFLRFRIISSYVYREPFHVTCRLYIKKQHGASYIRVARAFYTFGVSPKTLRTWTS